MTEIELQAIREANERRRALKAAATPGEWALEEYTLSIVVPGVPDRHPKSYETLTLAEKGYDVRFFEKHDGEFIVGAKNDPVEEHIDRLLDEIARLRKLLEANHAD